MRLHASACIRIVDFSYFVTGPARQAVLKTLLALAGLHLEEEMVVEKNMYD